MQAFKINGYAALPLVGGLSAQGHGTRSCYGIPHRRRRTSIPAAMAVWVLSRPQVFTLDITAVLSGTFLVGLLYQ
jgi:hypothetical protein